MNTDQEIAELLCGAGDEVQLCGSTEVEFGGQRYQPDEYKGYVRFRLSRNFPVVSAYGTAIAPETVQRNFAALRHQVFNLGHRMKAYHPDGPKMKGDSILGSVLEVKLVSDEAGHAIDGIASYAKLAHTMQTVVGQHLGGRHRWTVSMEVAYRRDETVWAVGRPGGDWEETIAAAGTARAVGEAATPEPWRRKGVMIVPWATAPEDLRACWDDEQRMVKSTFGDLPAVLLLGGLGGRLDYHGVGLVPHGAEPTAEIQHLVAAHPAETRLEQALRTAAAQLRDAVEKMG